MIALLVLITVLVITLYWAKRSRICKKNKTLTKVEIESADISQDHLDVSSSGYDDILSVSEVMRKKLISSNNVDEDNIPTSCNEAYGVAGVCDTQNSANKANMSMKLLRTVLHTRVTTLSMALEAGRKITEVPQIRRIILLIMKT